MDLLPPDDSALCTSSRPATPALVHSPSTARSSFSSREPRPPPPPQRQPSWGKRHASLDSPRERPTVVAPGSFGSVPMEMPESPTMMAQPLAGPPAPSPPHIHTPPCSPSARPYDYPFLPTQEPRGEDRPSVTVDVRPDKYVLICRMPHFHHSSITVATRRGRQLVITADRWDSEPEPAPFSLDPTQLNPSHPPSPAHFERRVTFGWDADMGRIRAEFDGQVLHVSVPRRQISHTMGLPRPTPLNPHPNRASAPGTGLRYNPIAMDMVPPELEMTRSHSQGDGGVGGAPPSSRRDVVWPLG